MNVEVVRGFDGAPDDVRVLGNAAQPLAVVFSSWCVSHDREHPVANGHDLHAMLPQKQTQQNVNPAGTSKDHHPKIRGERGTGA